MGVRMLRGLPLLLLLTVSFAGCVEDEAPKVGPDVPSLPAFLSALLVDAEGAPMPLALVVAENATGSLLWFGSSDASGVVNLTVASDVARLTVWRGTEGFELRGDGELFPLAANATAPLLLGDRVAFPNPTFPLQLGTTCLDKTDGDPNCGLDEPSIVVDGRGWIYYTAACCFFVSSPVFMSKDHGVTFEALANPFKDFYGNEGDLAVDDEGNLYYMDIDLATFGIARWNPDLSAAYGYRRPGTPLVDRPWIRAGAGGVVHAIYNTGVDTVYYRSTDHALTFSPVHETSFGSGLARAYSDVRTGAVGFVGAGDYKESTDGGATWGGRESVEGCGADTAAIDEAGTRWFQGGGCVVGLRTGGNWTEPVDVVPTGLNTFFTWVSAGAPGSVAVAYYATPDSAAVAESLGLEADAWYVFVSFSRDADQPTPHWATVLADPEPLGYGSLGRALGDFMEVAIGPDGAIHVAYARNPEMDDSATAVYRGTGPLPGLAPSWPLAGPWPDA